MMIPMEKVIIKMKISDQGELTDLLSADAYKELIGA